MGTIGKISSIKRSYNTAAGKNLGSSLIEQGMVMLPGTFRTIVPHMERNGEYRTGLDPEALYITHMSEAEATQEKERVKSLRDKLETSTGLDLSSKSAFYIEMWNEEITHAIPVKLQDGVNTYNLDDNMSAITYAWLRVHPEIAPSLTAWETGQSDFRCKSIASCTFFVEDEQQEASVAFNKKKEINRAINMLETMTPTRRLKIAKLLGLPVRYNDTETLVYNLLDSYIKVSESDTKKKENLRNFNSISKMADENLEIRYKVKEAIDFNVYRRSKLGKIEEGGITVAENEEELIESLSNIKNQDSYLALIKKIDNQKSVQSL